MSLAAGVGWVDGGCLGRQVFRSPQHNNKDDFVRTQSGSGFLGLRTSDRIKSRTVKISDHRVWRKTTGIRDS